VGKQSPNQAFQPDPPVRAFYLASVGGGGPVNLVSSGAVYILVAV